MIATPQNREPLNTWLRSVSTHIDARREERLVQPKPKRNRARERARREARVLMREYKFGLLLQDVE